MTLLVLAAGMGSRFGGLKQLEGFGPNGETLLDYSVYDAVACGFSRIVFVIRKEIDALFRERVGSRYASAINVDYVYQEIEMLPIGFLPMPSRTKPWGTGHAILVAHRSIKGPFAVINADDFYGRAAFVELHQFLKQVEHSEESRPARFAMVAYALERTLSESGPVSRGICEVDAQGHLQAVTEVSGLARSSSGITGRHPNGSVQIFDPLTFVSMNCWAFTPDVFHLLNERFARFLDDHGSDLKAEFYIPTAVMDMMTTGEATVEVRESAAEWFGVTHREDVASVKAALLELIERGEYPPNLWEV